MKKILLCLSLLVGLCGCDSYIFHTLKIETPSNIQTTNQDLEQQFKKLDTLVRSFSFTRVVIPEKIRKSMPEREVLAWYDSVREIARSRGSWMYFYFYREIKNGQLVVEFQQFPQLSEREEFVNAQKAVREIFGSNGYRINE